jgi:hypothetical protein
VTVTNLLPHNSNLNSFTVLDPSRRCKSILVKCKNSNCKGESSGRTGDLLGGGHDYSLPEGYWYTKNKIGACKVIFTEQIYYKWSRLLGKATMSQGWVEKDSLSGQWLSNGPMKQFKFKMLARWRKTPPGCIQRCKLSLVPEIVGICHHHPRV